MPIELEMFLRLLLAVGLGAIVGFQRGRAEKPAGLRDLVLICGGSALFTIVSIYAFEAADTSRVAAGIVAGIGFLGAGTIIRQREGVVKGLTTAATIWAVAGIGMAAGSGLYIIAAIATVFVLIVLLLPHNL